MTGWTEERVAYLHKRYIREDASGAIVGDELGITRSAVIGKAHRLGWLKGNRHVRFHKPYPGRPRKVTKMKTPKPKRIAIAPRKAPEPVGPVPEGGVPLMLLSAYGCKWATHQDAAGEWMFCGQQREEDRPYCSACIGRFTPFVPLPGTRKRAA